MSAVVAVGLLACLELAVRAAHPTGTVPHRLDDFGEHRALGPELDAFGAAAVSFVGSSRVREALLLPDLRSRVEAQTGAPLSVASYALTGGRATETELVVRKLVAADPPPRVIAYGLTPRQLVERIAVVNASQLWDLPTWWEGRRVHGGRLDRHLPQVLRNELARRVHAYRLRPEILRAFERPAGTDGWKALVLGLAGRASARGPMRGGLTPWQRANPNISRDVEPKRVQAYVDRTWRSGEWKSAYQQESLDALVARCVEAKVALVLFEVPVAPILREHLPPGAYERFHAALERVAERHDVPLRTLDDLGLSFAKPEFREQSHLNVPGAGRFTRAVADRVVLPVLTAGSKDVGDP